MKRIKFIILLALCLMFVGKTNAQQAPYYTQYMFNEYLVNPAVAGTYNYFKITLNQRIQWIGVEGAPETTSFVGYGPFKNRDMGYGGYLYRDVTGPESRLSFGGSYAYNIAINDEWRISGGLMLGGLQYKIDGTDIYIDEEIRNNDPALPQGVESKFMVDATAGIYAYTTYYFAGISAHQLLGNKYGVHEQTDSMQGISRLTQHLYLSGGANFILNRDFLITPSALIKYTPGQFQFEINAKVTYQRMAWGALAYRYGDAISIMGGYNYENKILIGIAYDLTVSDLRRYSSGTIEVMVGYNFNKIK